MPATIKSYVISLKRSTQRRERALAEQRRLGLPFEFVDAVDGCGRDGDFLEEGYDAEAARRLRNRYRTRGLSPSAQACALSHLSAYRRIADADEAVGLVCEDDAAFLCKGDLITELVGAMPAGWGVLYLYHRGDIRPAGFPLKSLVSFLSVPGGAVAYLVTRAAARTLLELADPLRLASDALLGRAVFTGLLDGYGVFPLLARHDDRGMSHLNGSMAAGALKKPMVAMKARLLDGSLLARRVAFLFTKPDSYFCPLR